jgi:hypothetical protein
MIFRVRYYLDMSQAIEVLFQILWLTVAVWFLRVAYIANKKAEPLSFKNLLPGPNPSDSRRDVFYAKGFVIGIFLLFLLAYKLYSCGIVCWT